MNKSILFAAFAALCLAFAAPASAQTGGRPAELFRFRREVVHERPAPGVRVPVRVPKRTSA